MALQDCTIYSQIYKHLIEKEFNKMSNKKKIKKPRKKIKKPRKTRETGKHNKEVIDGWRKVIEKI